MIPRTGGYYEFKSVDTNFCISEGFPSNGASIELRLCDLRLSQQWAPLNTYQWRNALDNRCLDVTSGVYAAGTLLQAWACTTPAGNQRFVVGRL